MLHQLIETSQQRADRLLLEFRDERARAKSRKDAAWRSVRGPTWACSGCDCPRDEEVAPCPDCGEVTESYSYDVAIHGPAAEYRAAGGKLVAA